MEDVPQLEYDDHHIDLIADRGKDKPNLSKTNIRISLSLSLSVLKKSMMKMSTVRKNDFSKI